MGEGSCGGGDFSFVSSECPTFYCICQKKKGLISYSTWSENRAMPNLLYDISSVRLLSAVL